MEAVLAREKLDGIDDGWRKQRLGLKLLEERRESCFDG